MPEEKASDMEPTHQAILQAIAEHRAESAARWSAIERRLDEHGQTLQRIPLIEVDLATNTAITKQYAEDQAFKRGVNARAKVVGVWGAVIATALAIWLSASQIWGHGSKLPPSGIGPQ